MQKRILVVVLTTAVAFTISTCGGEVPEPTTMSAPTNTLQPTELPTNTPEPTVPPTNTPEPTTSSSNTPEPTSAPTNTPQLSPTSEVPEGVIRVDVGESQDRGGVVITISAISLAPYEVMPEEFKSFTQDMDYWADTQTVGALGIKVENTTDQTINVHPAQGVVVVGNEQVDTALFMSDDVGGEIMAGVMKEGAVLFALKRQAPQDITSIRYIVDGPFDQDFNDLGEDYEFNIGVPQ